MSPNDIPFLKMTIVRVRYGHNMILLVYLQGDPFPALILDPKIRHMPPTNLYKPHFLGVLDLASELESKVSG